MTAHSISISISTETDFGSNPQVNPDTIGHSGRTTVVHKTNEEGGLLIDAFTGVVMPNQPDRPEWSTGYACAMLAERHGFYTQRLGAAYADSHKAPEAFNADDLGWLGLDEEGNEVEHEASIEYRLGVVKGVLIASGIIQDIDAADLQENLDGSGVTTYETMVDLDRERTPEEIAAIEKAATTGFLPLKTGTQD